MNAIDVELEQRTALAQKLDLAGAEHPQEGRPSRAPTPAEDAGARDRRAPCANAWKPSATLVLSEVNVKELVILDASESKLTKKIKPDFKKLGARMGKLMKSVAAAVERVLASPDR